MAVDAPRIAQGPRRCRRATCQRARLALAACAVWCALLLLGPVAAAPPSSVRLNLVDDFLDKGWTARYYQPYSHHTQWSDIVMPGGLAYHNYCMLMGAKNGVSASTLALAAIVDASTFTQPTPKNSPRLTRGVYWHMTDGVSCGFAADSDLWQGSADTSNSNPQYRLSWHLGQSIGGYRAGTATGVYDDTWYKVVYFIGVNCAQLDDNYMFSGFNYGPPPGVQFNMPNTLAAKGWTLVYDQPYDHATQESDLPEVNRWCIFVGAKSSASASTFTLGAFAEAQSVVSHTPTNFPRLDRSAWWYSTPGQSLGFSADFTLAQGDADVGSSLPERRLSWHLGNSLGGYRAGATTSLNDDSTWRKVIYQVPTYCSYLPDDLTWDPYETAEFPACANGLLGPRCNCSASGSVASTQLDMLIAWQANSTRFKVQLTNPHTTHRHVQAVALGPARCKVLQSSDFSCEATSSCPCTAYVSWSAFADACYAGQGLGPGDREFVVPLFVQWRQWETPSSPHATFQREQAVRLA